MAVAEVARTCGKAASGEGGGVGAGPGVVCASNRPVATVNIAQAARKTIALAAALVFVPLALQAQVVAGPGAPGGVRPQIFTTANGLDQVTIYRLSAGRTCRRLPTAASWLNRATKPAA